MLFLNNLLKFISVAGCFNYGVFPHNWLWLLGENNDDTNGL